MTQALSDAAFEAASSLLGVPYWADWLVSWHPRSDAFSARRAQVMRSRSDSLLVGTCPLGALSSVCNSQPRFVHIRTIAAHSPRLDSCAPICLRSEFGRDAIARVCAKKGERAERRRFAGAVACVCMRTCAATRTIPERDTWRPRRHTEHN